MPCNHLIFCRLLLFWPSIFPSIRVFSNESALYIWWPKYRNFSISPSNEYSGLISFRIDCFKKSLNKNKFVGIILPAVKTVSYQFIVSQLQIHPSVSWFFDPAVGSYKYLSFACWLNIRLWCYYAWGDAVRTDPEKVLCCLVVGWFCVFFFLYAS